MSNPSFCQEKVRRAGSRGRAVFSWGTNEPFMGDKRGPRRGHMRPSSGTNDNAVGTKMQRIVSQRLTYMTDYRRQRDTKT